MLPAVSPRKAEQANTAGTLADNGGRRLRRADTQITSKTYAAPEAGAPAEAASGKSRLQKVGKTIVVAQHVGRRRSQIWEQKEKASGSVVSSYVKVMQGHTDLVDVQEEAMIAICQMIANGHGLRSFIETGGIDAVVSAMNLHVSVAQMQQRGCAALCQVAQGESSFKQAILHAGGVQALVRALRTHL